MPAYRLTDAVAYKVVAYVKKIYTRVVATFQEDFKRQKGQTRRIHMLIANPVKI